MTLDLPRLAELARRQLPGALFVTVSGAHLYGFPSTDGDIDVLILSGAGNALYINDGKGHFTEITKEAGFAKPGKGLGIAIADFDGDGRIDVFIANDSIPEFLYHNKGNGTFEELGLLAGVGVDDDGHAYAGMGVDFSDYNNDGLPDLVVSDLAYQKYSLYQNNGDGTFTDVTVAAGIVSGSVNVQAAAWGDYDNDGHPDLYVTLGVDNGGQADICEDLQDLAAIPLTIQLPNILYHNNGDGTFTDVTTQSGTVNVTGALGVTWEDYDNDGKLDLYVVNSRGPGAPNRLFQNN